MGQLRGDKECPFSGNQIWQSLEEGAGKRCSECESTAHVRQAHKPAQSMTVVQSCPYTRSTDTALAPRIHACRKAQGSKEDLVQPANFTNAIKLDFRGQSWNADKEEEEKESRLRITRVDDDDEVMLNVLRCQLGTSCDQCRSTVH